MRQTVAVIKVRPDREYHHLKEGEARYIGDPHVYHSSGGDCYEAVANANELKWERIIAEQELIALEATSPISEFEQGVPGYTGAPTSAQVEVAFEDDDPAELEPIRLQPIIEADAEEIDDPFWTRFADGVRSDNRWFAGTLIVMGVAAVIVVGVVAVVLFW